MRCYLFDLDGTLADCSHRLHHIKKDPKDWTSFFAEVIKDEPITHVVELARALASTGTAIVYVSGRSDQCRLDTAAWLTMHSLPPGRLYMRKAGDHRNDDIVKPELLERVRKDGFRPIMAFEDRARVVASLRANGVPCAQVADGNF